MTFKVLCLPLSWRTVSGLALVALLLQVVTILLIFTQENHRHVKREYISSLEPKTNQKSWHFGSKLSSTNKNLLRKIAKWSISDTSGEFKVAKSLLPAKLSSAHTDLDGHNQQLHKAKVDVTLVTQCSLSHLRYIPALARQWKGPMSVALFVRNGELQVGIQALIELQRCFQDVGNNVTFSVVFPVRSSSDERIQPMSDNTSCGRLLGSDHAVMNYHYVDVQYPNNLLRNVARQAVGTSFVLVLDIDMMPSLGLHQKFVQFVMDLKEAPVENVAWVLPAYEMKLGTRFPSSKDELLRLRKSGAVQPFYQEMCWKCQKHTDYPAWENASVYSYNGGRLNFLYEVVWKDPWEPFYISRSNAPFYSESFRQYGFNRISQVCELHIAGYRFLVLDSVFVIHDGFKTKSGDHPLKALDLDRNRILYRQFKAELKAKYPESTRRCY